MKGKKILFRAGMLPYIIENGEVIMMFMKPSDTLYGGDQFQLCKGVVEEEDENYRATSLREGAEELGLRFDNILSVTELGNFLGRTTVFVAKVKDRDPSAFDTPHYETSAVTWMSCDEYFKIGRDLHKDIVQLAEQVIRKEEGLD
jgi:8-oxo-dGTP pyrophosphatase MutT (NUDIX family)